MVKTFDEFINEAKYVGNISSALDTPQCLLDIVEYINSLNLTLNNNVDGRVASIHDEDDVISVLKNSNKFIVVDSIDDIKNDNNIYIITPNIREWYDIEVVCDNKHYYVNIKSSNLNQFDNVGSPQSLLFGLFGKQKALKGKSKIEKYSELFHEYNKHEDNGYEDIKESDYYFLVINKNKTNECFVTSLNHINKDSIASNPSNLPFQCKWVKNSNKIIMDRQKVCDIIMETIFKALIKSIELFEKEPIKIYMNRHNKINNIPNISDSSLW